MSRRRKRVSDVIGRQKVSSNKSEGVPQRAEIILRLRSPCWVL